MHFILALLKAVPVLFQVWQKLEQDKQRENIENNVFDAWADKFGELQQSEQKIRDLSDTKLKNSTNGKRDIS